MQKDKYIYKMAGCEVMIMKLSVLTGKTYEQVEREALEKSKTSPLSYYGFLIYWVEQEHRANTYSTELYANR